MGFESVPWVDIWPSKNCCAKSFACLIHGDPLIRCSKGWPMAHFYHHSFAFAAFFVILVWSHLLFQTGKSKGLIARTHHSEAKGWRTWLWSQGKKKLSLLQIELLQYFSASMWFFFSLDVIRIPGLQIQKPVTTTNLVVWAHRRLWGQWYFGNFLR